MKRRCLTEGAGSTSASWFSLSLFLLPPPLKSSQTEIVVDFWALHADVHELGQSAGADQLASSVTLNPLNSGK